MCAGIPCPPPPPLVPLLHSIPPVYPLRLSCPAPAHCPIPLPRYLFINLPPPCSGDPTRITHVSRRALTQDKLLDRLIISFLVAVAGLVRINDRGEPAGSWLQTNRLSLQNLPVQVQECRKSTYRSFFRNLWEYAPI